MSACGFSVQVCVSVSVHTCSQVITLCMSSCTCGSVHTCGLCVPACARLQVYMYECTRVHVVTLCMRGCMYGSVYTCGHECLQVHVCMAVTWGL